MTLSRRVNINVRLIGGMATALHAQQAQLSQMRALLHQETQASGGTQTLDPVQQLQALAQKIEPFYKTMHTFCVQYNQRQDNKNIPDVMLTSMNQVDRNMTRLMHFLPRGIIPSNMTIQQMQIDVNQISYHNSVDYSRDKTVAFLHYMVAIRELTGILYDYCKPPPL